MKKRFFSLLSCLCMFACLCYPSHAALALNNAEEGIAPHSEPATYYWSIVSSTNQGITTRGEPRTLYDTRTAQDEGEVYNYFYFAVRNAEISGSVKVAYKLLEAELGFKIQDLDVEGKGIPSRPMAKGETVYVYTQPRYEKHEVTQKEVKIDQAGRQSDTGKTEVIYVYKPLPPDPFFEYHR